MQTQSQTPQIETQAAPRRRRSSGAVIAQYIQDLTHPVLPLPCHSAA